MLAILARSGQFLPRCLTFGPHNGPEDFCYVIDRFYSPGRNAKRRYCNEWLAYVDDLTIRTGRVLDGLWFSDAEYAERIKTAVRSACKTAYQTAQEALEAQGFLPHGIGKEAKSKGNGSSKQKQETSTMTEAVAVVGRRQTTATKTGGGSSSSGGLLCACIAVAEPRGVSAVLAAATVGARGWVAACVLACGVSVIVIVLAVVFLRGAMAEPWQQRAIGRADFEEESDAEGRGRGREARGARSGLPVSALPPDARAANA